MTKFVIAKGSHYEIGKKLGEACFDIAKKIQFRFRDYWKKYYNSPEWLKAAKTHASKFLPYAEEFCPEYIEEISGYSYSTGIEFIEIFAWFCNDAKPKGCTDIVLSHRVTSDQKNYLIHNEDYDIPEKDFQVLVHIEPDNAPSFLAMSYGGIWLNAGVNSCHVAVGGNGLSYNDSRIGIPPDFAFRKTFFSRNIREAMELSTPTKRAGSYCNVISDNNGEMYSMEASAIDFDALHDPYFLVHTNHYLSERMKSKDKAFQYNNDRSPGFYSDSICRYNRARNLVQDYWQRGYGFRFNISDVKNIMSDHVGHPWGICRHIDETLPVHERSQTNWSQIINIDDLTIDVCKGNPCENDYERFFLF